MRAMKSSTRSLTVPLKIWSAFFRSGVTRPAVISNIPVFAGGQVAVDESQPGAHDYDGFARHFLDWLRPVVTERSHKRQAFTGVTRGVTSRRFAEILPGSNLGETTNHENDAKPFECIQLQHVAIPADVQVAYRVETAIPFQVTNNNCLVQISAVQRCQRNHDPVFIR